MHALKLVCYFELLYFVDNLCLIYILGSDPDVLIKITAIEAILKEHKEMLDLILSNLVHKSSDGAVENANLSLLTDKFLFPLSTEQDLVELNQLLLLSCEKSSLVSN